MKLTIAQPQLLKSLQVVERAVNDRSTLPILSNVLLQTTSNELILTATDLDVGIQCRFPLPQGAEQGAVTLPARKLTTIIRELPDDTVTLEAKKSQAATVTCGTSSFRIPGLPAEDFPVLPESTATEGFTISQAQLKQLLVRTAYAMSMEETRFILNGALWNIHKGVLTIVATDGRRLAVASAAVGGGKGGLVCVIPAKTIRELTRLLQEDDPQEVSVAALKDNQVTFRFGGTIVMTRLIDGQFPPYEKVVPAPTKRTLTVNRQTLLTAVRRASLMTTATSQAVVFELAKDRLVVSKDSPELGSAREELAVAYAGDAMQVAFNPEFWLDVLRVLPMDDVTIELSGPDRPAVIRLEDFTYLVLPMKMA